MQPAVRSGKEIRRRYLWEESIYEVLDRCRRIPECAKNCIHTALIARPLCLEPFKNVWLDAQRNCGFRSLWLEAAAHDATHNLAQCGFGMLNFINSRRRLGLQPRPISL